MNFISFNSIFAHSVRFLVATFACAWLFFSSASPAAAMPNFPSRPSDGEVNLNEIQRRTDKTISDPPMTLEQVQKRSQGEKGGINEIQGAADINKMERPDNSQEANIPPVINDLKEALKDVTP
ncbi:hypothetical protein [Gloeocapsa sp. PCC 73106]|uniref:hypothetical protein n=1 Tax=Gloeocapsa sp. PCC 73106 TaxID=102232 RepID=UPI0002ABF5CF|nr:hypothetical protein [Gloeocapsa sp. PCC 73106]ELR98245.1 hypothetical protein GLO73106DRAFT_00020720 [Gloeocapsa sp. PCC 73106]